MIEDKGSMPIRQDIKVIQADNKNRPKLGWVMYEKPGIVVYSKQVFDSLKKSDWKFIWKWRWQRIRFFAQDMWNILINRLKDRKPSNCHHCRFLLQSPGKINMYDCGGMIRDDLLAKDPNIDYWTEYLKLKESGYCPYFQKLSAEEIQKMKEDEEYYEKHLAPRGANGERLY